MQATQGVISTGTYSHKQDDFRVFVNAKLGFFNEMYENIFQKFIFNFIFISSSYPNILYSMFVKQEIKKDWPEVCSQ